MGFFDHIRRRRRHREIKQGLKGYADPRLVKYIESHPEAERTAPRACEVEFVLVLIADENLEQLWETLHQVVGVFHESKAWVECASGSLLLATFGTLPFARPDAGDPAEQRRSAVSQLQSRFSTQLRILHGRRSGWFGDFGVWHFGSAIVRFSELIAALNALPVGDVQELTDRGDALTAAARP
jgi:hypothetical protein